VEVGTKIDFLFSDPQWRMSSTEDSSSPSQTSESSEENSENSGACEDCKISEFGYQKGKKFTLEKFREFSEKFEERWKDCVSVEDLEREYWRIVEGGSVCSGGRREEGGVGR
jgi:hypothetical protein